jgi:hypothetical protein
MISSLTPRIEFSGERYSIHEHLRNIFGYQEIYFKVCKSVVDHVSSITITKSAEIRYIRIEFYSRRSGR